LFYSYAQNIITFHRVWSYLDLSPQVVAQECGGLRVQLTVERRRQSAAVADVLITDAAGQILPDLSRVVL